MTEVKTIRLTSETKTRFDKHLLPRESSDTLLNRILDKIEVKK